MPGFLDVVIIYTNSLQRQGGEAMFRDKTYFFNSHTSVWDGGFLDQMVGSANMYYQVELLNCPFLNAKIQVAHYS